MYDENKCYSDVVYFDEDNNFSKEEITVLTGNTAELGEVLGKVTASGKYVPLNPAAGDGSEVAAAIAVTEKSEASGDADIWAIARHAIVRDSGLVWPDGITGPEKTTAIDELKSLGVLVK